MPSMPRMLSRIAPRDSRYSGVRSSSFYIEWAGIEVVDRIDQADDSDGNKILETGVIRKPFVDAKPLRNPAHLGQGAP